MGRLYFGGKPFDRANVNFCRLFHTERSWHTYWFSTSFKMYSCSLRLIKRVLGCLILNLKISPKCILDLNNSKPWSVHGPGAKPSYKNKNKNCPWTWSMTGGPWTRSMKEVHGPGPKRGSMDPWSMFCPHPAQLRALEDWPGRLGTCGNRVCVFYYVLEPLETALQSRSMSKLTPGDQNSI